MIHIRRAEERGRTRLAWLNARHTFSFGEFHDAAQMGFRALRVLNEDVVGPGAGFPTHSHRDMEILTWVLEGALGHRDSLGSGSVIGPGKVQRMSAGTGIEHSEYNASPTEPVHLLQVWILPDRRGLSPGYEQREFPLATRPGRFFLVASPDARDGSVRVHQDACVWVARLAPGDQVSHALSPGRGAWLQLARGEVAVNGHALHAGDGTAIEGEERILVAAAAASEVLLFDLA